MSTLSQRLQQVQQQIRDAALAANRPADDIQLLAVSKTHGVELIREAVAAGQRAFGESYLQEALAKMAELADAPLEWHFIGPIQSNKTAQIAHHFDWVHSVDRLKIAQRLNDQRGKLPPLNICIQVNTSGEASKAGVHESELADLVAAIENLPQLRLRGLMTIPSPQSDPDKQRLPFRHLRLALEQLVRSGIELDTLSMGMSGDLTAAIAEGATIVRIGTAIFGQRSTQRKN